MLRLLKYEWKACARACLPLYALALLMSVVYRVSDFLRSNTDFFHSDLLDTLTQATASSVLFGIMVAMVVVTLVILIQRFRRNLLGDEGYLMFTLPVTVNQLLCSKLLVAFAMSLLSSLSAVACIFVLSGDTALLRAIANGMNALLRAIGTDVNLMGFVLELLLLSIILLLSRILLVYLCMALGHLMRKWRDLMSVVWFFVISSAMQISSTVLLVILGETSLFGFLWDLTDLLAVTTITHIAAWAVILLNTAIAAAYYFVTRYILTHKLNLE